VLSPKRPPSDSRKMRRRHERQTLVLVALTLILVGGGLVGLIFGLETLLGALPCLLGGTAAILLLYGLFVLAERWVA
jgi:hypothetical protein